MQNDHDAHEVVSTKLVTAKTMAALLKKHPNTVYRWVRQAKIPHHRVFGRGLLFDPEAVKAVVFAAGN